MHASPAPCKEKVTEGALLVRAAKILPSYAGVDQSLVRERASVSEWPAAGGPPGPEVVGREDSLLPPTSPTQPPPEGARFPELNNTGLFTEPVCWDHSSPDITTSR